MLAASINAKNKNKKREPNLPLCALSNERDDNNRAVHTSTQVPLMMYDDF